MMQLTTYDLIPWDDFLLTGLASLLHKKHTLWST